jgi:hypothetical protein
MVRQETIVKGCMPVNIVAMPLDTVASDKAASSASSFVQMHQM